MASLIEVVIVCVGVALTGYAATAHARRFPQRTIPLAGRRRAGTPGRFSLAEGAAMSLGAGAVYGGAGAATVDHGWVTLAVAAVVFTGALLTPLLMHNRQVGSATAV